MEICGNERMSETFFFLLRILWAALADFFFFIKLYNISKRYNKGGSFLVEGIHIYMVIVKFY